MTAFDELKNRIRNKTVFIELELQNYYNRNRDVIVVKLCYFVYFGAGDNLNMDWLASNGCWVALDQYPTELKTRIC